MKVFLLLEGSLTLGPLRNSSARVQYEHNYRIYVALTHHRLRRALHHCSGRAVMGRSNTPYHDKLEVGICEACLARASNKRNYYRNGPEEPPACILVHSQDQKSTAPSNLQPSAPSDRRKAKPISIATCCEWHRKKPHTKGGGNENENKIDAVEPALPTPQFIKVSGYPGAVIPKFEPQILFTKFVFGGSLGGLAYGRLWHLGAKSSRYFLSCHVTRHFPESYFRVKNL